MATVLETAARSVNRVFSSYWFYKACNLFVIYFGFDDRISVVIGPGTSHFLQFYSLVITKGYVVILIH